MPSERYDLGPMVDSWLRSLRARNASDNTIRIYQNAARQLARYLREDYEPADANAKAPPEELEDVHREHLEAYITATRLRTSASNASVHYRALKTMFKWLEAEEEVTRNPMWNMEPPGVPEVEVPVIPEDDLRALFRVCKGTSYKDRRDTALLMLFADTGVRLSEGTDRRVGDLDLDLKVLRVLGKGDKWRSVPFGNVTAQALDRYLRAAAKYKGRTLSDDMWLWWGLPPHKYHRLTISGVAKLLTNRCEEADIDAIHPHQFRHTFAHQWKLNEGNDDDLMRITGWSSREMIIRYGKSAGSERARTAHARLSPLDRLQK